MVSEALQPLVKELPISEKRRLLKWLKNEVVDKPKKENTKLKNILIKHITKS